MNNKEEWRKHTYIDRLMDASNNKIFVLQEQQVSAKRMKNAPSFVLIFQALE